MQPSDVAENLSRCLIIADDSGSRSALISLLQRCLPSMRRALCQGSEDSKSLESFLSPHDYFDYCTMEIESRKREEHVTGCIYFFNCMLHSIHCLELKGTLHRGSETKTKQGIMVIWPQQASTGLN